MDRRVTAVLIGVVLGAAIVVAAPHVASLGDGGRPVGPHVVPEVADGACPYTPGGDEGSAGTVCPYGDGSATPPTIPGHEGVATPPFGDTMQPSEDADRTVRPLEQV